MFLSLHDKNAYVALFRVVQVQPNELPVQIDCYFLRLAHQIFDISLIIYRKNVIKRLLSESFISDTIYHSQITNNLMSENARVHLVIVCYVRPGHFVG